MVRGQSTPLQTTAYSKGEKPLSYARSVVRGLSTWLQSCVEGKKPLSYASSSCSEGDGDDELGRSKGAGECKGSEITGYRWYGVRTFLLNDDKK